MGWEVSYLYLQSHLQVPENFPFMSQELPKSLNSVSERTQVFHWSSDPLKISLQMLSSVPFVHWRREVKILAISCKSFLINPIEYLSLSQDNTMYLIVFSPVNSWYP